MGQNQETGNFPIERNGDVSLTDVTTDGDRNFLEKNVRTQIQSQRNKEDTDKQENVGSHDRKEKEGWRESYVIEDYKRSADNNYWDPQVAKRAEQQRECHEVISPIKIQNGPNEEAETIKDKEKAQVKKGRLKKLARQQQNNEEAMDTIVSVVGTKRRLLGEENEEDGSRKRLCGGEYFSFDSMAVAARQHR